MRSTGTVLTRCTVALLAAATCLVVAGSATATSSTGYVATDGSGNLVRVAVTGNGAGTASVVVHGNRETRQLSPAGSDGGTIVGLIADIDAGTTTLFTYDASTDQFHDLSSLGTAVRSAAIYAGGDRIAYWVKRKHTYAIRSVAATGGTPTTLYTSTRWVPWDIAVSEDGRQVFFSASDSRVSNVFRLTPNGKTKVERTVANPLSYSQLELSPDGTRLAVVRQRVSGTPRSRFAVVNLATGHVRAVLRSYANPIAGLAWAADGSSLVFRDLTGWARLGLHGRLDAIAKTAKLHYPVLATS